MQIFTMILLGPGEGKGVVVGVGVVEGGGRGEGGENKCSNLDFKNMGFVSDESSTCAISNSE